MDMKQARKVAGLSRSELSKYFGIPMATVDNWDYHEVLPPVWVERLLVNECLRIAEEKNKGTFNPVKQVIEIRKLQNDRDYLKMIQEQEKKKELRQKKKERDYSHSFFLPFSRFLSLCKAFRLRVYM